MLENTLVKYDLKDNAKSVTSVFITEFDFYSETDLSNRFKKAFLHLKKFYKKPISTEPL